MMTKQRSEKFVTLSEAEALTGSSRHTWRAWAKSGVVASTKIYGRLMVPVGEVARIAVSARAKAAKLNSEQG
jgi:hypothetical protein